MQMQASFVRGPLPPPAILKEYEEISPGLAGKIVSMAEVEGLHRRQMEEKALNANIESMHKQFQESRVGQIFALVVTLAFLIGGTYTAVNGHGAAGTIIGSVGLGTIVTSFIVGRKTQTGEPPQPSVPAKQNNEPPPGTNLTPTL